MKTCKIQWIDGQGNPTPDTNIAVGEAWMPERTYTMSDGRRVFFGESERFPICLEHLKRMRVERLDKTWRFEAFPEAVGKAIVNCKEILGVAYSEAFERLVTLFPGEQRESEQWQMLSTIIGACLGVILDLQKARETLITQEVADGRPSVALTE